VLLVFISKAGFYPENWCLASAITANTYIIPANLILFPFTESNFQRNSLKTEFHSQFVFLLQHVFAARNPALVI
jgi:hypothetical protein